jgi:proline racemase
VKEMNKMEFLHAQLEGYYNEKYSFYITIEREQMECYMYDCDGGDIDENSRGILSKLNEEIAVEIEEDLQIDKGRYMLFFEKRYEEGEHE